MLSIRVEFSISTCCGMALHLLRELPLEEHIEYMELAHWLLLFSTFLYIWMSYTLSTWRKSTARE